MGPKIIPSDCAHRDSHLYFYKVDHWDYHLSLLPFFKPLPFLTVSNGYSWRDPISSFELSKPSSESTKWANLPIPKRDWKVLKRLGEIREAEGKKRQKKERAEGKINGRDYKDLCRKGKVSSDRLMRFMKARVG